jgi:3-oxoacyl-ACP reductase-like protein
VTLPCDKMSGTPTPTWNNPLRSISRTSSVASTVSSVADDSIAGSEKPPVDSVSTTTATATTPNNDHRKDDKDSPRKTERALQQQQYQENVSNMVFPLTAAARTLSVAAASNITSSSNFLNGKLVLVTGGSGTIGMAIATALVKHKASVVLTGRNVNRLKTAVEKIREACPEAPENSVKLVSCDVSKEDSVEKLFNTLDVYKDKRVDIVRAFCLFIFCFKRFIELVSSLTRFFELFPFLMAIAH